MAANQGIEGVGKIISDIQDELEDFKLALENMPGIGKGTLSLTQAKCPPS